MVASVTRMTLKFLKRTKLALFCSKHLAHGAGVQYFPRLTFLLSLNLIISVGKPPPQLSRARDLLFSVCKCVRVCVLLIILSFSA